MSQTDAQKRANAKYRESGKVKQVSIKFFPKDHDVYLHLKAQPKMAEYVISLVRKDMGR